jgi:hypothetical protein
MAYVRGPMELPSDKVFICDHCGREVKGDMVSKVWMGRVMAKPIHCCSKECFDKVVKERVPHGLG